LEHRFQVPELNSLKGLIGEYLARSFIRNVLAFRLIETEKWDHIVFTKQFRNRRIFDFNSFREDFTFHGFHATSKLLSKYAIALGLLRKDHCKPDGLILKLRETGYTKPSRQSLLIPAGTKRVRNRNKRPTVDGDLEVVEIKCGRSARLMSKQKKTYSDLIAKGIPLRVIKVKIVSFDSNRFLVEESRFNSSL
jgi:hypothetical protein